MRKIISAILLVTLFSCKETILEKNEFVVVDTLKENKNKIEKLTTYDVIVKYDSSYHVGKIDKNGELIELNVRKITLH